MESGTKVAYAEDTTQKGEIIAVVVYESRSYLVRFEDGAEDWFESSQVITDDQEIVADPLAMVTEALGRDNLASNSTTLAPRRTA